MTKIFSWRKFPAVQYIYFSINPSIYSLCSRESEFFINTLQISRMFCRLFVLALSLSTRPRGQPHWLSPRHSSQNYPVYQSSLLPWQWMGHMTTSYWRRGGAWRMSRTPCLSIITEKHYQVRTCGLCACMFINYTRFYRGFTHHLNVCILYTAPYIIASAVHTGLFIIPDIVKVQDFVSSTYVQHEFRNFWYLYQLLVALNLLSEHFLSILQLISVQTFCTSAGLVVSPPTTLRRSLRRFGSNFTAESRPEDCQIGKN